MNILTKGEKPQTYDQKLFFSLLACPLCHGHLAKYVSSLRCLSCKDIFPIRNGIPVFIPKGITV